MSKISNANPVFYNNNNNNTHFKKPRKINAGKRKKNQIGTNCTEHTLRDSFCNLEMNIITALPSKNLVSSIL